ncbi:UNKNOWN [Stylonychia lemnae]|uniref:Uncharacterized protein n=1 Tax=Stylonychia lemnae TaxID=5949 RepID=A0A077ZUD2_STYLE|nr:UNKNOWN [Stylonychia lemnae]|eukprot:CDW73513.1 UNKNOWN [Stylonychia lemnae]
MVASHAKDNSFRKVGQIPQYPKITFYLIFLCVLNAQLTMNVNSALPQISISVPSAMKQQIRELPMKMTQTTYVVRYFNQINLVPLTSSSLSSDLNCEIFYFENQYNCLICKSGYYLDQNGYFNSTANIYQDICLSSILYQNGVDVIQESILACLDGYVDQQIGKCVANCGVGKYGAVSFGYKSMIESTVCMECDSSCHECTSQFECISCKKGFYLNLEQGKNVGKCELKSGQFESTIYVKTRQKLETETIIDGSINQPYHSLQDALTTAYILGSPYQSAIITILLFSNQSHSMTRYQSNLGIFKNPDKNSQTTKIIIDTIDQVPVIIYYKLRDKVWFLVGGGLTIKNIQFDATDSILDLREQNIDLNLIESEGYECLKDSSKSCCQSVFDFEKKKYVITGQQFCQINELPQCYNLHLFQNQRRKFRIRHLSQQFKPNFRFQKFLAVLINLWNIATNILANSNGGILYIGSNITKLTIEVKDSIFDNIMASNNGSFIYFEENLQEQSQFINLSQNQYMLANYNNQWLQSIDEDNQVRQAFEIFIQSNSEFANITLQYENFNFSSEQSSNVLFFLKRFKALTLKSVDLLNFNKYSIIQALAGKNIEIDQVQLKCQALQFDKTYVSKQHLEDDSVNFIESQFNLQNPTPFVIRNVDIIQVTSSNFQNCYYQQHGGIFNLQNTTLYDAGSIFSFNQAMSGGAVYCEKCHAIFNQTQFSNNFALNGGSISVNGPSNIQFIQNLVQNTYAYNNGGFIYAYTQDLGQGQTQSRILKNFIKPRDMNQNLTQNNSIQNQQEDWVFLRQLITLEGSSLLKITQLSQISQTYAYNRGGAIYVDSKDTIIEIEEIFQQSSRSYKQMGGFIHSENSRSISITRSNFTQYQSISGSFLASVGVDTEVLISTSRFDQNKEFIVPSESEYSQLSQQDSFGAIFVNNAESLLLMNNQFFNNYYSKFGGVIAVINSSFQDIGSTYRNSVAHLGGVIYFFRISNLY